MKNLPPEGTLPPSTLTVEPITYQELALNVRGEHIVVERAGGRINGVDYNGDGQSQQDMISRLSTYVAAHGGTLVGVQFDPSNPSMGFFIVTSGTPLIAQQYTFSINTHTNVVTVNGPFPWQL